MNGELEMKKGFIIWLLIVVVAVAGAFAGGLITDNGLVSGQSGEQNESVNNENDHQISVVNDGNKNNDNKAKDNDDKSKIYTMEDGVKVYYVSGINKDMMGQTVTVKCKVANVKERKDTVFFILQDIKHQNKTVNGVMFKKTNTDNKERKEVLEHAAQGNSTVYIEGQVDEYKGALEVKAWKVYTK